jgi:hypothetical protein
MLPVKRFWVVATLIATALLAGHLTPVAAQEPGRAALIVRLDEENVEARCVAFSEPQITGYELLRRSGLEMEASVQGMGALVCQIQGLGCPPGDCLCQCKGGEGCTYWSYWHQTDDEWRYAPAGASAYQVSDGSVEGWSWGPGSVAEAVAPPPLTFEEVCSGPIDANASTAPAGGVGAPAWQSIAAAGAVAAILGAGFFAIRKRDTSG